MRRYVDHFPISIHAPLTGSDWRPRLPGYLQRIFQSTLPLRGATAAVLIRDYNIKISIHAPLTGSDGAGGKRPYVEKISIHAPLTGSDSPVRLFSSLLIYFNPRSPYGERRSACRNSSIGDYFNPRSPYGERRTQALACYIILVFQSTLPLRGATGYCYGT